MFSFFGINRKILGQSTDRGTKPLWKLPLCHGSEQIFIFFTQTNRWTFFQIFYEDMTLWLDIIPKIYCFRSDSKIITIKSKWFTNNGNLLRQFTQFFGFHSVFSLLCQFFTQFSLFFCRFERPRPSSLITASWASCWTPSWRRGRRRRRSHRRPPWKWNWPHSWPRLLASDGPA